MPLNDGRRRRIELVHDAQSLQERTLTLLECTADIFKLTQPWEKVKSGLSDARIREFYRVIAALWPPDLDYQQLLPKPDSTLKALYLGENDPEMMLHNVFRFSLYADQVILVHPFTNPNRMRDQFNPLVHPEEWRVDTLRLVYHLRILLPWIAAGIVVLVPDPGDFDHQLFMKTVGLAKSRFEKQGGIDEAELDELNATKRTQDMFFLAPDNYLVNAANEAIPGITEEEVEGVLKYIKQRRANNPLLPSGTLDTMPGQMSSFSMGTNLEMGLFLCQAMGAFPYTNVRFRWREILSAGDKLGPDAQVWSPLTKAFSQLDFKFLDTVQPEFAVAMREEGRLASFRSYTRRLWKTVGGDLDLTKAEGVARDFSDELKDEYAKAKADWDAIDRDLLKWGVPAFAGLAVGVGGLVTGHYQVALPGGGFAVKGVSELIQAHLRRKEFRKKTPLSVFLDLEAKGR